MTTYNLTRRTRFYVTPESTFGVAADHAATDAVPHRNASLVHSRPESEVDERKNSAGLREMLRDGRRSVTWSFEGYIRPSGSAAAEPDVAPLLKAAFGSEVAGNKSSTTTATAHATTSATVATVAKFAVGAPIRFTGNVTTAIANQTAIITGIASSVITWAPAITNAPGAAGGDTINAGYGWVLTEDNQLSVCLHQTLDNTAKAASGCFVNELSISASNTGPVVLTASGEGCGKYSQMTTTELSATVATAGTSLTVGAAEKYKINLDDVNQTSSDVPIYAKIGNEIIKITKEAATAFTATRAQKSTSATTHATGASVTPWSVAYTAVGNPISGLVGSFLIDGISVGVHSINISLNNGFSVRENELGAAVSNGFFRSGNNPRRITMEITAKAKKQTLLTWGHARDVVTKPIWLRIGSVANKMLVFYAKTARFQIPDLPEGDGEAILTLTADCLETATTNDELYMGQI